MPGYNIRPGDLPRLKQEYITENPMVYGSYIQDYIIREADNYITSRGECEVNTLYRWILENYIDHLFHATRKGSKPAWQLFFRWICRSHGVVFCNPEDEVIIHYSMTEGIVSVESNIPDWRGGLL